MIEAMNAELWTDLSLEEIAAGSIIDPNCSPNCICEGGNQCNYCSPQT